MSFITILFALLYCATLAAVPAVILGFLVSWFDPLAAPYTMAAVFVWRLVELLFTTARYSGWDDSSGGDWGAPNAGAES